MWGAGCVAYFLLTSLNPFLAENDQSPIAAVAKYTFPDWPRRPLQRFQVDSTSPSGGDRILVRGATFEANDFLNNMIVRWPSGRMSVNAALQHPWICDTTPRYGKVTYRCQGFLQDAIHANGHPNLLTDVLQQHLPRTLSAIQQFHWPYLEDWPNTSSSLIGAAKSSNLEIINLLLQCPWLPECERSEGILFQALRTAVQAGHQRIQSVLLPLIQPAQFSTHEWCRLVAGYMDLTSLITTIERYQKKSTSISGLARVDIDCFGYRVFFPTMPTAAMKSGKIESIKHLLSDPLARQMLLNARVVQQAAGIGRLDVVQLLMESYTTELEITATVRERVFDIAARKGHLEVVRYMLAHGVLPDRDTIQQAVLRKNRALVQLLLNSLIQENSQSSIAMAREWALCAIPSCNVGILRWLDNLPSSVGPPNTTGEVSSRGVDICAAARAGDIDVVRYLLKNKQPYSLSTTLRSMALIGAIKGGHRHIIKDLCSGDIDLTAREPWRVAARKGHVSILKLLLQSGRPLQGVMDQMLGVAATAGHLDAVMFLLNDGALWNGPCGPIIRGVLAAFGHRGGVLPEIGGPASRRI